MLDAIAELEAWIREQERRKIQTQIDKYTSLKGSAALLIGTASAALGALEGCISGSSSDCELESGKLEEKISELVERCLE